MSRCVVAMGVAAVLALAAPRAAWSRPGLDRAPDPRATARGASKSGVLDAKVRRGVVIIERRGLPAAMGVVLGGDRRARILTALSSLKGASDVDVLYADGSVVHARLTKSDQALDVALLAPDLPSGSGLEASELEPEHAHLRVMCPVRGPDVRPAPARFAGRVDVRARTGGMMRGMLSVSVPCPSVAGAPLVDGAGAVVGLLVRECRGPVARSSGGCRVILVGMPIDRIRAFLSHGVDDAGGS